MFTRYRTIATLLLASGVTFGATACAVGTYPYRGGGYDRGVDRRAFDEGYRAGLEAGRSDARHGVRYDPAAWRPYQDAGRGRNAQADRDGRYGRTDRYDRRDDAVRDYRQGFRQGYDEGYRRTRRR